MPTPAVNQALQWTLAILPAAALAGLAVGIVLHLRRRGPGGSRVARRQLLILLGLTAATTAWNAAVVGYGPVVYFDEFAHAEMTAQLAREGSPNLCCAYRDGRCEQPCRTTRWPLATHVLAATVVPLTDDAPPGAGFRARVLLNRVASFLSPALAYTWVFLLVGSIPGAALAALAWGLFPARAALASSAALMPVALALALLLLIAVECWRRRPTNGLLAAIASLAVLTMHGRLELFLVVPWVLWRLRGTGPAGRGPGPVRTVAVAALAALVPLVWLYVDGSWLSGRTPGWGQGAGALLENLGRHLPGNLAFWLDPSAAPVLVWPAGLLAFAFPAGRRLWPLAPVALALLLFDSSYYIGRFDPATTFDGWRFALPVALLGLPLFALALAGIAARLPGRRRSAFVGLVAAAILAPLPLQYGFLRASHHPLSDLDAAVRAAARCGPLASTPRPLIVTRQRTVGFVFAQTGLDVLDPAEAPGAADVERALAEGRAFFVRVDPAERPDVGLPGVCVRGAPAAVDAELGAWLLRLSRAPCGQAPSRPGRRPEGSDASDSSIAPKSMR
ncbi:MAG: hypothetical protein JXB32_23475 [Deltaproteobacteria bacterium]|nr:hypothetical protein [Deltaproteobacteria bacterium]